MLTIEKKNSPRDWIILVVVAATTATITTFIILALLEAWTSSLCRNVPLTDYVNHNAPAKCQERWVEGRI